MGKVASKQVGELKKQVEELEVYQKKTNDQMNQMKIALETRMQVVEQRATATKGQSDHETVDEKVQTDPLGVETMAGSSKGVESKVDPAVIEDLVKNQLDAVVNEKVKAVQLDMNNKIKSYESKINDTIRQIETKLNASPVSVTAGNVATSPKSVQSTSEVYDNLAAIDKRVQTLDETAKQFKIDLANFYENAAAGLVLSGYLASQGFKPLMVPFPRIVSLGGAQASDFNDLLTEDYGESWPNMPNAIVDGAEGVEVITADAYSPALTPRTTEVKLFGVVEKAESKALNQIFSLEEFPAVDYSTATHLIVFESTASPLDFVLNEGCPSNAGTVNLVSKLLHLEKALACLSIFYRTEWENFFPLVQAGIVDSSSSIVGTSPEMLQAFVESPFADYTPRLLDLINNGQFTITGPSLK